jgi:hypothetical protein
MGEVEERNPVNQGYNVQQFHRPSNGLHRWIHIIDRAAAVDSGPANMHRLIVDGVELQLYRESGFTGAAKNNFWDSPLNLMGRGDNTAHVVGWLSDPIVFHRVLTDAEIASYFKQ